ncbi:MAG: type II toxin-antitoxin system death-on-curing family toxin [Plesiomonas sp.]|uniref:type II toxin-antitoxin system death-on-curing family toxin n=1 Tax=Plesiomonas sp. TaxID=2486279 RepID=UPI003F342C64
MISTNDVLSIHDYLAEHYVSSDDPISPPGIKNMDLLESAIHRPFMTVGRLDAYPSVIDKASVLFHAVISNHCFHNGNKRTALLITMCYLDANGYWIDKCDDNELFEFTRKVAAHEITDKRKNEIKEIKKFLKKNARKIDKQDRQLTFIELSRLLSQAGFLLETDGDVYKIMRGEKFYTKIIKKGSAGVENYDPQYVKKMRKKLGLTSINGWDSTRFYRNGVGLTDNIGELLRLRGAVMDRLAKI